VKKRKRADAPVASNCTNADNVVKERLRLWEHIDDLLSCRSVSTWSFIFTYM